MRFKVPFLRYAVAAIAFLLPVAVLAAVLPFLINAQPVRAQLLREIGSWTGGEVKVAGAVSIKNFFSLSVEASDVEIGRFKDIAPLEGMRARTVVARVAWSDLLLGRFDFDKIKISGAVFKLRAAGVAEVPKLFSDLISGPETKPFAALAIDDSLVALRGADGEPYQRLTVSNFIATSSKSGRRLTIAAQFAWQDRPVTLTVRSGFHAPAATRVPLNIRMTSDLLTGEFNGEAMLNGMTDAAGSFSLNLPSPEKAAAWLGIDGGTLLPATSLVTSGQVSATKDEISLTSGEIALGGQNAQTALTVKRGGALPHLAGTLAFNHLDLTNLLSGDGWTKRLAARASIEAALETDLRISAKTVARDGIEAGPLALTLTSRPQRLTAEIAEFDFLGGEVRGHLAVEATNARTRATARLSAENLEAGSFLLLAGQRDWLTGAADVNLEAEAVWTDPTKVLDGITARARVNFPDGGQIRLDMPGLNASADGEGWGAFEFANTPFEKLRFEMTLRDGQLRFADVILAAAGREVNGRGQIDLAKRSLDWRFTFAPESGATESGATLGRTVIKGQTGRPAASRLSIKGPWVRPVIRSDGLPDSSMLPISSQSAAALELSASER